MPDVVRRPTFNLVTDPWLPCEMSSGEVREFSLKDLFRKATGIRDLVDPSPLVRVALYRLLLAILYRTHAEAAEDWPALWDEGWGEGAILDYLEKWRGRFDLFSPEYPFYQRPDIDTGKKVAPVTKLSHELVSGNNKQLPDHSRDDDPPGITPARAARLLVGCQAWGIGGGVSGGGRPNFTSAPLPKGACMVPLGANLRDTLLLNLVPLSGLMKFPRQFVLESGQADDRPAWERAGEAQVVERPPDGMSDYLTWQARYVRLLPAESGNVHFMVFAQGEKIKWPSPDAPPVDPFHAFTEDSKGRVVVRGVRPDRAVWRDAESLFAHSQAEGCRTAPALFNAARNRLSLDRSLDRVLPVLVSGIAVPGGQPPPDLWCADTFRVPANLVIDQKAFDVLHQALELATDVARLLHYAIKQFAETYLQMSETPGDPKAIKALTIAICREDSYWSQLEAPFLKFLPSLAEEEPEVESWHEHVRSAVIDAFEASLTSQDTTGRHWKARTAASGKFLGGLYKLIPKEEANDDAKTA